MLNFAPRLERVQTSVIREIFKLLSRPGIISFAGGFPDASMFDVQGIQAATDKALSAGGAVLQYGATEGYEPLREQLSQYMADRGVSVSPDGLIVTTGSQQVLDLIGKTMLSKGDKVIVEAPTFLAAIQAFRLYGAELIDAPVDAEGVEVEPLEALIAQHQPKLVYLIPTFGNPHGARLSLQRRQRILALAAQYKVLVVEDDPYGDLYFSNEPPPPSLLALSSEVPGSRDWLCYAGSLSKVLAPGLRLGWMVAPSELLVKATMCKQFSDAHTSTLAQAIAACYLASGRMPKNMERVRVTYAKRAERMAQGLRQHLGEVVCFTAPLGGMFIWARLCKGGTTADEWAHYALAHNVAFVPGSPFFAQSPDRMTFRLSFATSDLETIDAGVARLAAALGTALAVV